MRLYHVLLATAAALLASNNGFAVADEKCTIVTKAPESTPIGSSSYASSGSSADTPVTQDSTAASDVGASQETTPDSPVQQYSNPGSDAGTSEASTSDADDTEQTASGSYTPSSVDASQKTDVASSAETAGDADQSLTFTEVPKATTLTPTVASSASASGSSSSSIPTTSKNSTSPSTSTSTGENSKLCAKPRIEITEVNVGESVDANEEEAALKLVAIAAIPGGGSRVAFHSGENVIVQELDASDKLVSGSTVKVPVHDFADIYADKDGFVILGTR
ncbi:hypothetical protein F444_03923, partial [Phytophthora nicotianae P1976]